MIRVLNVKRKAALHWLLFEGSIGLTLKNIHDWNECKSSTHIELYSKSTEGYSVRVNSVRSDHARDKQVLVPLECPCLFLLC